MTRQAAAVAHWLTELAGLALPAACGGCGAAGVTWCPRCAGTVDAALAAGPRPTRPDPGPPGLPPAWTVSDYAGPVKAAIVAWKDADRRDLTRVLAPMLRCALSGAVRGEDRVRAALRAGRPVLLVPVPSSRASVRRRGDAPLLQLLRQADDPVCRAAGMSVTPALGVVRRVADQAGLGQRQRAVNLAGAFAVRGRHRAVVAGTTCLLVDDVVTTGATLVEAARALRAAGASPVAAVTLAATGRRPRPAAAADGGTRTAYPADPARPGVPPRPDAD